jgi:hypothetical protein
MNLERIQQIIKHILKEDDDLYSRPEPARINRLIYERIFIPIRGGGDELLNIATLTSYIKTLDKTRIKTAEEYLQEVNDAPVNLLIGTRGYMPPEMYVSLAKQRQLDDMETRVDRLVARNRTLHSNSEPSECELSHLNLNDLISNVYLKYMYNPEQLHSCRHLIRHKINSGERIDTPSLKHLRQIDNDLYQLYIAKRVLYNPMTALGVKKRKSRKVQKSRKINRRKSKYVKKY